MGRRQVIAFDADDEFLTAFGSGNPSDTFAPVAAAPSGEELFVVDIGTHRIAVFDLATTRLIRHIGEQGSKPGRFVFPYDLAPVPEGGLLVTDFLNTRVQLRSSTRGHPPRSEAGQYPGGWSRRSSHRRLPAGPLHRPGSGRDANDFGRVFACRHAALHEPEQADGDVDDVDIRTDVYSLGVLLDELMTGRFPYDVTGGMANVLHRITACEPISPARFNDRIPDDVTTIILKAMAKEKEHRYASAVNLADYVERYLAGEAISDEEGADLRQATEGLAALYEAWSEPDQAAAWRKKIISEIK